jgi:hypothetical protein
MRRKISELGEAFTGHSDDHHRFLLTRMLGRIDGIDADIAAGDEQIEVRLAPFAVAAKRLDEIPGIGPVAAAVVLAGIGPTCPGSRPRAPVFPDQVSPPASPPLPGTVRPGPATATWPGSWARPQSWPERRIRSWANPTEGSPGDKAKNKPSSPSDVPFSSSSGTCCRIRMHVSMTSPPTA